MTQAEIENHMEVSGRLLRHAGEQYELGDLIQASEKSWGAVAHYLKSVAKSRRWRNMSHNDLYDVAYDLAQETDDPERALDLYLFSETLHINFYENRLIDGMVGRRIDYANELISLLEGRALPPQEPRPSQEVRRILRQRNREL